MATAVDIAAGVGPSLATQAARYAAINAGQRATDRVAIAWLSNGMAGWDHAAVGVGRGRLMSWFDLALDVRGPLKAEGAVSFAVREMPKDGYVITQIAVPAERAARAQGKLPTWRRGLSNLASAWPQLRDDLDEGPARRWHRHSGLGKSSCGFALRRAAWIRNHRNGRRHRGRCARVCPSRPTKAGLGAGTCGATRSVALTACAEQDKPMAIYRAYFSWSLPPTPETIARYVAVLSASAGYPCRSRLLRDDTEDTAAALSFPGISKNNFITLSRHRCMLEFTAVTFFYAHAVASVQQLGGVFTRPEVTGRSDWKPRKWDELGWTERARIRFGLGHSVL